MKPRRALPSLAATLPLSLPLALALTPVTQENGPQQWNATLPGGQQVSGNVLIGQGPGGNGVSVQASFAGLPATGGPFRGCYYH